MVPFPRSKEEAPAAPAQVLVGGVLNPPLAPPVGEVLPAPDILGDVFDQTDEVAEITEETAISLVLSAMTSVEANDVTKVPRVLTVIPVDTPDSAPERVLAAAVSDTVFGVPLISVVAVLISDEEGFPLNSGSTTLSLSSIAFSSPLRCFFCV